MAAKNYKVFDGTTWVSPCDQEVRMLMPDGVTWRLIDPANEDVKYFDGTTWKPMICVDPSLCPNCVPGDVTIATQTWTRCNASITTYNNGDVIPEVSDPTAWAGLTTGAWCHVNNDPTNEPIYGRLYNWYAINDPRGFAPPGYHVPTSVEWNLLINSQGGSAIAGGKLKESLYCHWYLPNTLATNLSGFTALPGGERVSNGAFSAPGILGLWWSATPYNSADAESFKMVYNSTLVSTGHFTKKNGHSVRFIKD